MASIKAIIDKFKDEILFNPGGTGEVEEFVAALRDTMSVLLGALVIIYIAYKVMVYFSDIDKKLDPYVIIRPMVIMFVFFVYQDAVDLLVKQPMDLVNGAVVQATGVFTGVTDEDSLNAEFEEGVTFVDPTPKGPVGSEVGLYEVLGVFEFFEALHLLIQFVASVVGWYILFRQMILLAIYYIVGVVAIPFSMIAGNQGVIRDWLFGFIAILMWEPMLNIMKGLIAALQVSDSANVIDGNPLFSLVLQIVMITTILQIPNFANLVVSKGASVGSEVGSKMTGRWGETRKKVLGF